VPRIVREKARKERERERVRRGRRDPEGDCYRRSFARAGRKCAISLSRVSDHFLAAKRRLACRDPDVSALREFTRVRARNKRTRADANATSACNQGRSIMIEGRSAPNGAAIAATLRVCVTKSLVSRKKGNDLSRTIVTRASIHRIDNEQERLDLVSSELQRE